MSGIKEQGDLFWTLTHQDARHTIIYILFSLEQSRVVD